jgi:hypothetical protein
MKTDRSWRMARNLVLALASAFIFAGAASAQLRAYTGNITLPFDVRWGGATLPAGDYTVELDEPQSFCIVRVFRGTKSVALIRSKGYSMQSSGANALIVVRGSAGATVRDLSLPGIGVVLHYTPHKPGRTSPVVERETARVLPVTTSGK